MVDERSFERRVDRLSVFRRNVVKGNLQDFLDTVEDTGFESDEEIFETWTSVKRQGLPTILFQAVLLGGRKPRRCGKMKILKKCWLSI